MSIISVIYVIYDLYMNNLTGLMLANRQNLGKLCFRGLW